MFKKRSSTGLLFVTGLSSLIQLFTGCSGSSLFFQYGYNISHGHVYYKQSFPEPVLDLANADARTFKVISRKEDSAYADNVYFGTDEHSVYYKGYIVPGSDGPSFQLLHVNYAKDKGQCYYKGEPITGADPATFKIKDDDFSADKNHIFRWIKAIDHDPSVFESFTDSHVVHTANTVAVYDALIPVPPGAVFKHLGLNYFALSNQLYFHDEPMPDGDVSSFTPINDFFSRTNRHVYYGSKIITGADPASHELLDAPYSRDKKHIFFFEKTITGADVKTFEILNANFQCARDKNAAYNGDKRITNFSTADLTNKNQCINCTESALYFAEAATKN